MSGGFFESAQEMGKSPEGKKCFFGLEELKEMKSAGARIDGSKE
jgi:hypothetical protein